MNERIFAGVFPGGISYADRQIEQHGDYKRLAFLPFDTLTLKIERSCPAALRADIVADAAAIQARRGQQYQVSTSGQTVTLGSDVMPTARLPLKANDLDRDALLDAIEAGDADHDGNPIPWPRYP